MEIQELNQKVLNIWEQNRQQVYMPVFFQQPKKHSILFVGFNPSLYQKNVNALIKRNSFPVDDFVTYCLWENRQSFDIEISNRYDRLAVKQASGYFDYFIEIAQDANEILGTEYERQHQDLFLVRNSRQHKITDDLFENKKNTELTAFAKSQLELSWHFIQYHIQPEIMFVANAESCRIIKKYYGDLISDRMREKHGFYLLQLNERDIPLIMTSQITSTRRIDRETLEILKWMVRRGLRTRMVTE